MIPSRRGIARAGAALVLLLALASAARAQTTYTWNDSNVDWTSASAWSPSGPTWTSKSRLTDAIAAFGADNAIANTPTIGSSTIYVNGITIDNSGAAAWSINGTGTINLGSSGLTVSSGGASRSSTIAANVRVAADQTWNIAAGNTVTLSGALSGAFGLTKSGAGTLTLASTGNMFLGGVTINAGTLSVSGATAITNALRANMITLGSGVSFTPGANARFGGLAGSGTVSNSTNAVFQTLLGDASSSASVTSGQWNVAGQGTQTFTGTTSGISGTVRVYGASSGTTGVTTNGLTLSGNATLTGTSAAVSLRGGTLTIDNSGTNITDRLRDAGSAFDVAGGVLKYIGQNFATDITESTGILELDGGSLRVDVTHGGGAGKTTLQFSSLSTVGTAVALTIASGGGAGALDGTQARIMFSTAPTLNKGVIAFGSGDADARGYVLVNASGATNFATYDSTKGVVAITPTSLSGSFSSTTFDNVVISSAVTANTSAGNLGRNTVTFRDGGSLDISGSNDFGAYAILFTGSGTASITSSGGGNLRGGPNNSSGVIGGRRYFHVTDPAGVLSVSASLGPTGGFSTSGDGTVALTGLSYQLYSVTTFVTVTQGTLRGNTTALGGTASTGGASTWIALNGGVLEIDGSGSASAVSFARGHSTAASSSGGTIGFLSGGGFSAINAPGGVDVTLMSTPGGSTADTPTWGVDPFNVDGYALLFGSPHSDSRITLTNSIKLDSGTVATYNAREIRVYDNPNSTGDYARLSGVISGSSASDLLKTGPGTLELTGANTYSGNTIIAGGTLKISTDANLGNAGGSVLVLSGGTLELTGAVSTSRTIKVNSGGTFNTGGNSFTSTGTFINNGTYTGTTTVGNGGVISGTGTVGTLVVNNGGTVAPGNSPGTLTVNGDVTFNNGSTFAVEIAGPSSFDKLYISNGNVTINSGSTLGITFSGSGFTNGQGFVIVENANSLTGTFTTYTTNLGTSGTASNGVTVATYGGFSWKLYYNAVSGTDYLNGGGNNIVLAPVPEPGSILLVCAAAGGVGYVVRKRRRRRKAAPDSTVC